MTSEANMASIANIASMASPNSDSSSVDSTECVTAVRNNARTFWTPDDRQQWIKTAINSDHPGGRCEDYTFSVMPKLTGAGVMNNTKVDEDASKVTDALARVIYNKDPRYRILSLGFYMNLLDRVRTNQYIGQYYGKELLIIVKGSNAHAILMPQLNLPYSDLDIIIYINPFCNKELFNHIRNSIHIILVQLLSHYKKTLDHMLFLDTPNEVVRNIWGISEEVIKNFKEDHIKEMEDAGFVSPFVSTKMRNMASRHSIVLLDSNTQKDMVVRVEVPHFNMCEKIPLRRTPIFCSYNETIHNDGRDFNLYRMKFNNMVETEEGKFRRVQADFIDVTIPLQTDTELLDNWQYGRFALVNDAPCRQFIAVPDLSTSIRDLHKMLTVYECPEHKREKRQAKYDLLLSWLRRLALAPDTYCTTSTHPIL